MAFIVARPNGTWEARESFRTDRGSRSRTLATFRELTPEVERRIWDRASGRFEIDELREKARRAGVPVRKEADQLAARLLRKMSEGEYPASHLGTLLASELGAGTGLSHAQRRMTAWAGTSARERGEALVDLLGVGDALPPSGRRRRKPAFPRIESRP